MQLRIEQVLAFELRHLARLLAADRLQARREWLVPLPRQRRDVAEDLRVRLDPRQVRSSVADLPRCTHRGVPKSALGTGVLYTLKNWDALCRSTDAGYLEPDTTMPSSACDRSR